MSGEIGIQPITEVSSTDQHGVGSIIQAVDTGTSDYGTGEFIYLKGVASTVAGDFVGYYADGPFTTTRDIRALIGPVAIAMAATVANKFGWYQISGKAVGNVLADYAENALVYATSTVGSIDDAVVGGDRVQNALSGSAIGTPAAGQAEFELNRPFVDQASAA